MKFKKHLIMLTFLLMVCVLASCGETENKRVIPGWDDTKQNVIFYTWGSKEENILLQNVIDSFAAKEEKLFSLLILS